MTVRDPRAWRMVLTGGSAGLGEAYLEGMWEADDLTTVLRILSRATRRADTPRSSIHRATGPVTDAVRRLRRQDKHRDRTNIQAHYDLGNDFFEHFLDPTMMYSAAVFPTWDAPLEDASREKLDRLCRLLDLRAGERVVEIGTGWGGFAVHAARHHGALVTTTTISAEQHAYAVERVAREGLSDRITVLHDDYRDLTGTYDKIVSIEMIEAIGHQYYDTYFAKCSELLAPHGAMLLQAITIADQRYERARRSVDFIQRYIFPGSCIPSVAALSTAIARASDLRLFHLDDIGPHYATTLAHWRQNLRANLARVRSLGYGEEFIRMWEYYFCYCEGGFMERVIGDVQMLLVKPGNRRMPV